IKISEKGTVNAQPPNLTNVKLYAQEESTCTFVGSTQIGTIQSFSALEEATFTSLTLSVGTSVQQCVFVVLDVGSAAGAGGGQTVAIEISNSGDVAISNGTPAGTFPAQLGSSPIRLDQGTIMSTEVDFDWMPGQTSWGEVILSTTETDGDVKIRIYYTVSVLCDTIVPESALAGNAVGFDAAAPINISGLNTTTYNRICLQATLVAGASAAPTLNDWAVKWGGVTMSFSQSAYRLFQNEDNAGVTTAFAMQDTSATISGSQPFRLRLLVHVGGSALTQNGQSFKLQYAPKPSACGAYSDITSGTAIAYINNPTPNDGDFLTTSVFDPIHGGDTTVSQTYEETNNFTKSKSKIPANQDGEWDFALKSNGILSSGTYCIRAVKIDNSVLDTYTVTPEIKIAVYTTSGTYISSNFNANTPTIFSVIEWIWSKSNQSCASCNIKLQIKTAPDNGGVPGVWTPTWSGPLGNNGDELDYYTMSTGEMVHPDHNDQQWIKYRATFEGDSSATPILDEIKIYYKP
ncbi:MAG: hypothetical protein AAB795_00265, partial [Patescibacteria group bacterium]